MNRPTFERLSSALLLSMALTCLGAVACGTTAGVPVAATLAFESLSDGSTSTPTGWQVRLRSAVVWLGPVYGYAPRGEPGAAAAPLGPSVARAHGGFDPLGGRLVRAEYLEQLAFDALGGEVEAGAIFALEGAVDELSVVLDAPRGDATATRGHHAFVAGTAERDGVTVTFEGGLDLEEGASARRVDGVSTSGALVDGGRLVVGVDASRWFAEANFEGLSADETVTLTTDDQPMRAWRLGARSAEAFSARTEGANP